MSDTDSDDDDEVFYDARETLSTPAAPSVPPDTPREVLDTPVKGRNLFREPPLSIESVRTLGSTTMPVTRPPRRESLHEQRMEGLRNTEKAIAAKLESDLSEGDLPPSTSKSEKSETSEEVPVEEPAVEPAEEVKEIVDTSPPNTPEKEEDTVTTTPEPPITPVQHVEEEKEDDPAIEAAPEEFVIRNLDTGEVWTHAEAQLDPELGLDPITMRSAKIEQKRTGNAPTPRSGYDSEDSDHESKRKGWRLFGAKRRVSEDEHDGEVEGTDDRLMKIGYHKVRDREFNGLYLAQELDHHDSKPVWVVKFSVGGEYLATAGGDGVIRVYEVYNPRPTSDSEDGGDGTKGHRRTLSADKRAPIVNIEPIQVYNEDGNGHEGDVLDIMWSRNNFILSASTDRTVRLWHVSTKDVISIFRHTDFVTAIAFHPKDDRYFLSGSLDGRLRIWNILEEKVVTWVELKGLITAATFSLDGKTVLAGSYHGVCTLFDASDGLQFVTEIKVRSTRGRNARESKITGIEPLPDGNQVLITSNDSRIRLYNIQHDTSLHYKYRGHENERGQIKAHISNDCRYLITGSEDNRVYIWRKESTYVPSINPRWTKFRKDRSASYEYFSPTRGTEVPKVVTDAIFAPVATLARLNGRKEEDETSSEPEFLVVSASHDGVVKFFIK